MKLTAPRMFTLSAMLLAVSLYASIWSVRVFAAHSVHAAVKTTSQALAAPTAPSGRDGGWQQLTLIRSVDPDNLKSTNWRMWSNKCALAVGLHPPASGDPQIKLAANCSNIQSIHQMEGPQLSRQNPDPKELRLGSVYFNAKAATAVLAGHLDISALGATDVLRPVKDRSIDISPSFPQGSAIVKAIWELAPVSTSGTKHVAQLHFFNLNQVKELPSHQLPKLDAWPSLTVDVDSHKCSFAAGDTRKIDLTSPVPIGCFITNPAAYNDPASMIVNHVPSVSCAANCVLVLVGIHVAYKESNQNHDWKWTTFWWTDDPNIDPHFQGHPPGLPAEYTHFVMDTSYANPGPMYNPYQEGSEGKGATLSHCAGCHDRAATMADAKGAPIPIPFPHISDSTRSGPASCAISHVCTDSIWSIATSRDETTELLHFTNLILSGRNPHQPH